MINHLVLNTLISFSP